MEMLLLSLGCSETAPGVPSLLLKITNQTGEIYSPEVTLWHL